MTLSVARPDRSTLPRTHAGAIDLEIGDALGPDLPLAERRLFCSVTLPNSCPLHSCSRAPSKPGDGQRLHAAPHSVLSAPAASRARGYLASFRKPPSWSVLSRTVGVEVRRLSGFGGVKSTEYSAPCTTSSAEVAFDFEWP